MAGGVEPRHPGVRARTHHHHGCTGKVREFNPAAERVFGYSREQAVGKDWPSSSFRQPCASDIVKASRAISKLQARPRAPDRNPAPHPDGEQILVELAITAFRIGGEPVLLPTCVTSPSGCATTAGEPRNTAWRVCSRVPRRCRKPLPEFSRRSPRVAAGSSARSSFEMTRKISSAPRHGKSRSPNWRHLPRPKSNRCERRAEFMTPTPSSKPERTGKGSASDW